MGLVVGRGRPADRIDGPERPAPVRRAKGRVAGMYERVLCDGPATGERSWAPVSVNYTRDRARDIDCSKL